MKKRIANDTQGGSMVELKIGGYDDRTTVVGILNHNGYTTKIEERPDTEYPSTRKEYWIVIS